MVRPTWDEVKAAYKARPGFDTAAYNAEVARMEQREQFGLALREARQAAELTQTALARLVGSTQPAIARLEAGMVDPKLSTLQRLAEVLGRPIEVYAHRVAVAG
jgi:HTH-type transcriptional regulator / antitoxin HipB